MDTPKRPTRPVTTPATRERRVYLRSPVKVAASLTDEEGSTLYGWVQDIGCGGMYFVCRERLPVESYCTFLLMFSEESPPRKVVVEGWVVRSDAEGMGVQFNGLDGRTFAFIRHLSQAAEIEK